MMYNIQFIFCIEQTILFIYFFLVLCIHVNKQCSGNSAGDLFGMVKK